MKRTSLIATMLMVAAIAVVGLPVFAQQTTGAPGSPGATTTIDGRYLPAPPPRFDGQINLNALQSTPAWLESTRAAPDKPQDF